MECINKEYREMHYTIDLTETELFFIYGSLCETLSSNGVVENLAESSIGGLVNRQLANGVRKVDRIKILSDMREFINSKGVSECG